jgi:hypothetical protein
MSILDLTRSASLIFSGTVVKLGASDVPILPAREHYAVIQVDRNLRVDSALGNLRSKSITMATKPGSGDLKEGQKAVFFTRSWIHGKGIAVHEVGHLGIESEDAVAKAVADLPDLHLKDRLQSAERVVLAEVSEIRDVANQRRARSAPFWSVAVLRVVEALKGGTEAVQVLFPTSKSRPWFRAPRFTLHQRGVFLLHADEPRAVRWLEGTTGTNGTLTALEAADVQPESRVEQIKELLIRQ